MTCLRTHDFRRGSRLLLIVVIGVATWPATVTAQYSVTGSDFLSEYSIRKEGRGLSLSAYLPDRYGKPSDRKGSLWEISSLDRDGRRVGGTILNGYVWTPRVQAIDGVRLDIEGNITEEPGFNFDAFKRHPGVIAFANGYAVNLFMVRVKDKAVVFSPMLDCYLSDAGQPLLARLIRPRQAAPTAIKPDDRLVAKVRTQLKRGSQTLATIHPGTRLVAETINGPWVGTTLQVEGKPVRGWIYAAHLEVPGAAFEELVFPYYAAKEIVK